MKNRITIVVMKDGKPVTNAFCGPPRAAYLGALHELGYTVDLLSGSPAENAMAIVDLGIELKPVRLGKPTKKRGAL